MLPDQFCYWLRGFLEMADPKTMNENQVSMLKKHLDLVFVDVTSEKENKTTSDEPQKQVLVDSPPSIRSIQDRFRDGTICGTGALSLKGVSFC